MPTACRLLVVTSLLIGPAVAQTVRTVDRSGGADFTSLASALAVADDGDVLLCSGTWGEVGVVLEGRGVSIVEAPGAAIILFGLTIRNVPAPQSVQVLGVEIDRRLRVHDCSGGVLLEGLTMNDQDFFDGPGGGIEIERCRSVAITDCDLRYQATETSTLSSACVDVTDSTVVVQSSDVIGADGLYGYDKGGLCTSCCYSGTDGAAGMRAFGASEVRIVDSRVEGGDGGRYFGGNLCVDGWDAPALRIEPGASAVVVGSQITSTAPSTGAITYLADVPRTLELALTATAGGTIPITLRGEPGDTAFVLVGPELNAFPGTAEFGVLQVSPSNGRVRLGALDATGFRSASLQAPFVSAGSIVSLYVQAVYVRPGYAEPRCAPARRITVVGAGLPTW